MPQGTRHKLLEFSPSGVIPCLILEQQAVITQKWPPLGGPIRDSAAGFLLGAGHTRTSAWLIPQFQTPQKRESQCLPKPQCRMNGVGLESHPYCLQNSESPSEISVSRC